MHDAHCIPIDVFQPLAPFSICEVAPMHYEKLLEELLCYSHLQTTILCVMYIVNLYFFFSLTAISFYLLLSLYFCFRLYLAVYLLHLFGSRSVRCVFHIGRYTTLLQHRCTFLYLHFSHFSPYISGETNVGVDIAVGPRSRHKNAQHTTLNNILLYICTFHDFSTLLFRHFFCCGWFVLFPSPSSFSSSKCKRNEKKSHVGPNSTHPIFAISHIYIYASGICVFFHGCAQFSIASHWSRVQTFSWFIYMQTYNSSDTWRKYVSHQTRCSRNEKIKCLPGIMCVGAK